MMDYRNANFPMFDLANKQKQFNIYMLQMLARTQSMFKWEGLPETIPQRELELLLQQYGHAAITNVDGELWAVSGGFGGVPNQYYMPTEYLAANPALPNLKKPMVINEDCIVMKNDSMYIGLVPIFNKYITQMVENDLTMLLADVNTRMVSIITASDEATRVAGMKYLDDIKNGKPGVAMTNEFYEGLKTQPFATTGMNNQLTQLIEYQQYIKASMFHDIGLDACFNMKREALNSSETDMNSDALYPFVDDMLAMRKLGAEQINDMFGTNISVEFNSTWKQNEKEQELIESQIEQATEAAEEEPTEEVPEEVDEYVGVE